MADITITPVSDITLTIDDGTSDITLQIPSTPDITISTSVGQGPSGPAGLDSVVSFASFADFIANLETVLAEPFIKVLVDETKQNRQTLYVVEAIDEVSLDLDFINDNYRSGNGSTRYFFLSYVQPQYVDPPLLSTSDGFFGAIAADNTYFYFHTGVRWLRVAGSVF